MRIPIMDIFPKEIREAPAVSRLEYIAKKKRESVFLYRLCLGLCAILVVLKIVTFFDPAIDPANTVIAEIVVIATPLAVAIGLRKLMRRYSEMEIRLRSEVV